VSDRTGRLRALVLLAALALGNSGMVALAFPAQSAPLCHELATPERLDGDARCQWASPTACCDASVATQADARIDPPALAPVLWAAAAVPPTQGRPFAHAEPEERVPLPARPLILRL
jgi:hypothetical protein